MSRDDQAQAVFWCSLLTPYCSGKPPRQSGKPFFASWPSGTFASQREAKTFVGPHVSAMVEATEGRRSRRWFSADTH